MVQQSSGLTAERPLMHKNDTIPAAPQSLLVRIRTILGIIWVVFSTITESLICLIISFFSISAAHAIGRFWSRQTLATFGIKIEARGLENVHKDQRYVFVANHQSHLDIPALYSILPHRLTFLAKKELFYIPFFGWGIYRLGHIAIDRSSARKARLSFNRAVDRLKKETISLVIFPEGTRSATGEIGEFKRGSFALPVESGLKVVPVRIDGTISLLKKKNIFVNPGTATVSFGAPIDVTGMRKQEAADTVHAALIALG